MTECRDCEGVTECGECGRHHKPSWRMVGEVCCPRVRDTTHVCGRSAPPHQGFCGDCINDVRAALDALPEDYTNLYLALPPGVQGMTERHTPGFESQVPLVVAVSDLMARIAGRPGDWGVVFLWDRALRVHLGYGPTPTRKSADPARSGQAGVTLVWSCRFLGSHATQLCGLSADAGDEVLGLHREAQRLTGMSRAADFEHLREPPCPRCSTRTLVREYGSDVVVCGRCLAEWRTRRDVVAEGTG